MSNCKSLFGLEELLSPGPSVDTAGIVFRGWWSEVFGQFFHTGRSYPTSGRVLYVLQSVTGLWYSYSFLACTLLSDPGVLRGVVAVKQLVVLTLVSLAAVRLPFASPRYAAWHR